MPFFAALLAMLVFCTPAAAQREALQVDEAIPLAFSRLSHAAKDELRDIMDEMAEVSRVKKARRDALGKLQKEIGGMQNQTAKDEKQRRIDRLRAKIAEAEKRQQRVLDNLENRHAEEQAKLGKIRARGQENRAAAEERRKDEEERQAELKRDKAERTADEQRRQKHEESSKQESRDRQDEEAKPPQEKPCPPAQADCNGSGVNTQPAPKGLGNGQNSGAGYPSTTHPELLPAPPMELYRPHAR